MKRLNIQIDNRGWEGADSSLKFKVDTGIRWYTKAELEAIDFSNMKGKDISIMGAKFYDNGEMSELRQSIIHFAGDSNSKVPTFFKRPSNARLPRFYQTFPNFSLNNKINILHFGQLDSNFNPVHKQFLNKGYNIIEAKTDNSVPIQNRIRPDADGWMDQVLGTEIGVNRPDAVTALNMLGSISYNVFRDGYHNNFTLPHTNHGAAFHDLEYIGYIWGSNQSAANRLATAFKSFKQNNPNTLLLLYLGARGTESAFYTLNNNTLSSFNNKYNSTAQAVSREFFTVPVTYLDNNGNPTVQTGLLSDYTDAVVCGNYLMFISKNTMYWSIMELELAKKYFPSKKALSLNWSYMEAVPGDDFNSVRKYFKTSSNEYYFSDFKPTAPPSHIYNIYAWSNFIGDGVWTWHNPVSSVEGYDYWGGFGKDPSTGQNLPIRFSPNQGESEISNTINLDYGTLAMYELSFNNDILSGNEPILNPEYSIDGGVTYKTSVDLLPASADLYQLPIVRIKKHPSLNEWLLLAMNFYNPVNVNQTIKVKIPNINKTVDIILNGQFTTINRLRL